VNATFRRRVLAPLVALILAMSGPAVAQEKPAGPVAEAVELLDAGRLAEAEKAFERALAGELSPEDRAAALIYLARLQLMDKRYEVADATAAAAIEALTRAGGPTVQATLIALSIRFEAARALGDEAKAAQINRDAARLSARQDMLAWATDEVPGGLLHRASGAVLPESVAGMSEFKLSTYDAAGLDGSVSYTPEDVDPSSPSAGAAYVTAYVTVNMGRTLAGHFDWARDEIVARYPDAREITSGPIAVLREGRRLEGRMGVFAVREGGEQSFTTVHVFRLAPDTHVKFRATYPTAQAEVMRDRVAALMQTMVWPDGETIQ
jgi:tetratricopeptide (TPR) repeat protein